MDLKTIKEELNLYSLGTRKPTVSAARKHGNQLDFSDADWFPVDGGVIVSAVDDSGPGPIEEAGIGPLSLAKVKGIDPRPRAKEARLNSSSHKGFMFWG